MDLFLKILFLLLMCLIPFCFGGAEPWAFTLLQGGLGLILGLVLFSKRSLYRTPLLNPVLYIIGILVVYGLVQSLFPQTLLSPKISPYPSTLMRLYTLEHVSYFITYGTLVLVVMQLFKSSKEMSWVIWSLIVCALAVAACALCLAKGEYIYVLTGIRGGYGPFLNRNHGGIFLASCTLLCLGWTCAAWADKKNHPLNQITFIVRKSWALLATLLLGIAAVFSRSRGGMLSLTVGLFVFTLLMSLTLISTWKKRFAAVLLTLALFGSASYWAYSHIDQINRFARRNISHDTSIETRKTLYRAAREMLQDYPIWGIGIGALPVVVPSYLDKPIRSYVERLHSDWLEILVGIGWAGAILILGGLLWYARTIGKRFSYLSGPKKIKLSSLVAAGTVICIGAIADFPFFIPATACLFFLTVGLSAAPLFWKEKNTLWTPTPWVRVVILLLFCASCWIPLQKTRAWRLFLFGKNLKMPSRISHYQKGLAYYPSPRFAVRLGNTYYNASLRATSDTEREHFRQLAYQTAVLYLQQYPKDKELSKLYARSRPR